MYIRREEYQDQSNQQNSTMENPNMQNPYMQNPNMQETTGQYQPMTNQNNMMPVCPMGATCPFAQMCPMSNMSTPNYPNQTQNEMMSRPQYMHNPHPYHHMQQHHYFHPYFQPFFNPYIYGPWFYGMNQQSRIVAMSFCEPRSW